MTFVKKLKNLAFFLLINFNLLKLTYCSIQVKRFFIIGKKSFFFKKDGLKRKKQYIFF